MLQVVDMLKRGPDGNLKVDIGQAILCWNCGMVAIPENLEEIGGYIAETRECMPPFAKCKNCHESDETNYIKIMSGQNVVPFIERKQEIGAS